MRTFFTSLLWCFAAIFSFGQTNLLSTNATAEAIMLGNYDPADYTPPVVISDPDAITSGIQNLVSPDSLKSYLLKLRTFENRNSGSDTVAANRGIGAARRWVYQRFQQIGVETNGRLVPSYLQFDQNICSVGQHRNIFAVLPGIDTSAHGVILIEAHIDSRCAVLCDTACLAEGMEDNGSGTALVLELARVMSQFSFERTIVFMATIAEEQGLYGADAFALYAKNKGIPVRAVLNNDIVGGIACGETSSPPSCPGLNNIDSTQVRLFSSGGFNSPHKQLVRFLKLQYQEELLGQVQVPMTITVMSAEDRTGRGGDHIPFRQRGFTAMRFTSANEHGDAGVSNPNYNDRQHTSKDILGVDTNGDVVIDSFFVDFNYLARNAVINGTGAAMAAIGPVSPDFAATRFGDSIYVTITDPLNYGEYRIFYRTSGNDFDTIFTVNQTSVTLPKPAATVIVSAAAVDADGIESLFTREVLPLVVNAAGESVNEPKPSPFELLQNRPNPFDEATYIGFRVLELPDYREALVLISDAAGREVKRLPVKLELGMNEVIYEHGYNMSGVLTYSLVVDGKVVGAKQMVFAN
ncbi:MAG: M28 family peptidase [Bacteroidetes bacterium]|nr:M28 family peptidase [Bacteroidota bacterium]